MKERLIESGLVSVMPLFLTLSISYGAGRNLPASTVSAASLSVAFRLFAGLRSGESLGDILKQFRGRRKILALAFQAFMVAAASRLFFGYMQQLSAVQLFLAVFLFVSGYLLSHSTFNGEVI
ncbi:MAG: hypothetical protein ABEJ98_00810 [Candidatus Nanohaloarchaea archaeon]